MIFGYARISTQKEKQKTDRQLLTLNEYAKNNNFKFDKIYEEKISGSIKSENRPIYTDLRKQLRPKDVLIITDVDRLGRDADNVILEFKSLKSQGVRVIPLDTPFINEWDRISDDSTYEMISDIYITLKAHMAQQEKEKLVSRINQGLAATKAKGTKLGRRKSDVPEEFIKEYTKFKNGDYGKLSVAAFAKSLGIARSTVYKYINKLEKGVDSDEN